MALPSARKPVIAGIAIGAVALLLGAPPVLALDPSLAISQYSHTAWTVRDGYSLGTVFARAQTPDGYLWLGSGYGIGFDATSLSNGGRQGHYGLPGMRDRAAILGGILTDPMTFKVSGPTAQHLRDLWSGLGAALTGRRTFDKAHGWDGRHAWGPAFVVTHEIPAGWPRPNSTVHFVTDGIASAVKQAKAAAGGKSVGVHGADTIQQLLKAGLLDELSIDIAAVCLGAGVGLFDHLAGTRVILGNPTVIPGVGVTHLRYPVCKA